MGKQIRRNLKRVHLPLKYTAAMLQTYFDRDYILQLSPSVHLPSDVVVVAVDYDARYHSWSVILFHESWPEVSEHLEIPLLSEDGFTLSVEAVPLREYLERLGWRLEPFDPDSSS